MKAKKIYNTESNEPHNEAVVLNGNPDGIINLNGTNHQFATTIYKNQKKRTWFVGQVSLVEDIVNYGKAPIEYKRSYDLILAQLITNDSIQVNQLMDNMNRWITSPVINLCLSVQSMEEGLHGESYSAMAEDVAKDTNHIYNLHKHDNELALKNKSVADMYLSLYKGNDPTEEDFLIACGANQVLEELVFPGGFAGMYLLGDYFPGSAELIREINGDETLSHVPLFKGIFRAALKEIFNDIIPDKVRNEIYDIINKMVIAEKRWTKYALKDISGSSDTAIDFLVEEQANSVCSNLKLPLLFKKHKVSPLNDLLDKNLKGSMITSRTNFFTGNVTEYSKNSVEVDF